MQNYVCFDLETGGLNPELNPITEIALIVYNNVDFKEQFRFESFVAPYNDLVYDKKAMEVTGITKGEIDSGISINELVEILILVSNKFTIKSGKWHIKPIFVGHNISEFDILFIDYIFKSCNKNLYDYYDRYAEDTLKMSRNKWEGIYKKFNLKTCCNYIGLEIIDAHRAINDVIPNSKLHKHLIDCLRSVENKVVETLEKQETFRETFQL